MLAKVRRMVGVGLVAMLVAAPAVASAGSGRAEVGMQHGLGTVTTTHENGVLERSVEVWYSPDGKYRVITRSLDGSQAVEEVVFNGAKQTAYIADDGGHLSVIHGDFQTHFAVQKVPTPGIEFGRVTTFRLALNGLADHVVREFDSGSTVELALKWETIPFDSTLLNVANPDAYSVGAKAQTAQGVTAGVPLLEPMASGNRSHTFNSIIDYTPCVYATNSRNTETGYFRAASNYRGSCWYMDETLWKGQATFGGASGGSCTMLQWLGSGPTAARFSSKYLYTDPANMSPTCSTHAGWLTDWSLAVPWNGLNTA